MKNKIILFIILSAAFSCNKSKVEPLFDQSTSVRTSKAINDYKTQLSKPQFGWKGAYYPNGAADGGYSFYLKFDIYGNLTMYSDVAGLSADQAFETTYQMKAFQKPTLIFDSYSYLHELVNPDYNGGTGQFADLELTITEATDQKITLKGIANNTELILTTLSNADFESVKKGGLKDILKNTIDIISSDKYSVINFASGEKADVFIDLNTKKITIYFITNNKVTTKEAAFITTPTGLQLRTPISIFGTSIQELLWDNLLKTYYFQTGNNKNILAQSIRPALPFYSALSTYFSAIVLDPEIPTQSASFKKLYNDIRAKTIALSTSAPVRVINEIYFFYIANDGVFALVFDYSRTYPDRVDTFGGVLFYEPTIDQSGNVKFKRLQQTATLVDGQLFSGISEIVNQGVKQFTDILEKDTFNWDFDTVEASTATLKSIQNPSVIIKGKLFK